MADGFDVVAVGVADERTEVVLVVLGPDARFVEHLGAVGDGGVEEGLHGSAVGSGEGEVRLAEAVAGVLGTDPEVRELRAVADRLAEVEDPRATERSEDGVVERRGGGDVGALDGDVIDHVPDSCPPVASPTMPAGLGVSVEGLDAAYGPTGVLHGVSLSVDPGEIVALLGPSGCGKTTLLRCIAGLEAPTAGRIVIGDRDVTAGRGVPAERRRVGMVFQEGALFPHKTVAGNVGYGVPRGAGRQQRSSASLDLVGLGDKATRMPGTLSGGEQQRVALARALAPEPGVILLDEPFSSLDAGLRAHLRSDVRRLLTGIGVTTILVTHDQDEALTFGDRVAVMRSGTIEQVGSPPDIYARPASPWVAMFVGEANLLEARFGDDGAVTAIGVIPAVLSEGTGQVLCRPEQLRLASSGPAAVSAASYFGRDTRYEVDVPDAGTLTVRTPGAPEHHPGDAVTVRFVGTIVHGWPSTID